MMPHAHRWRLPIARTALCGYPKRVPEKKGAGLGRLNTQSAQTAQRGFFSCFCLCMSPMGGGGGDALGRAGFFGCQSTNPTIRRSPRLVAGRGLTATQGGIMPSSTRTSEHSPAPLCINELALQSACSAVDMTSLGASCVDDLAAIFTAIISLSADNSAVYKLARIATDLADEYYQTFDLNNQRAKEQLAAIRAAAGGAHE